MLLLFAGLPSPSVDQLASETSLSARDNGLTTPELKALAAKHGLTTILRNNLTTANIEAQIQHGSPTLALINYGYLVGRQNQADASGHFVIVTGFDAGNIYINDPDWWGSQADKGHNFKVPRVQFEAAIRYAPVSYQGLTLVA